MKSLLVGKLKYKKIKHARGEYIIEKSIEVKWDNEPDKAQKQFIDIVDSIFMPLVFKEGYDSIILEHLSASFFIAMRNVNMSFYRFKYKVDFLVIVPETKKVYSLS